MKYPSNLIDIKYYAVSAGESFSDPDSAYQHFRCCGQSLGLNPSPYFESKWYAWQNPDSRLYPTVLDHFMVKARDNYIDTAPFIDSVELLSEHPHLNNSLGLYEALLGSQLPKVSPDVDVHLEMLSHAREKFFASIQLNCLRDNGGQRRKLVWVQTGGMSQLPKWFDKGAHRSWDLLCNIYDITAIDLRYGDIIFRQSGTKFTGIAAVYSAFREILSRYDYLLFIDDDLEFHHGDLDRVFQFAEDNNLDLFQPSLTQNSCGTWPGLFQHVSSGVRIVSGVEVMMFGFSKRAFSVCADLFRRSVSGFGLDLACSEEISERKWKCGVIDSVAAGHHKPISESNGLYYKFMRDIGIKHKLELYENILKYGKYPNFTSEENFATHMACPT